MVFCLLWEFSNLCRSFFKVLKNVGHFLKVFIEFVAILLLFYVLGFSLWGMWDLRSLTKEPIHTPSLKGEVLTTGPPGKSPFCIEFLIVFMLTALKSLHDSQELWPMCPRHCCQDMCSHVRLWWPPVLGLLQLFFLADHGGSQGLWLALSSRAAQ